MNRRAPVDLLAPQDGTHGHVHGRVTQEAVHEHRAALPHGCCTLHGGSTSDSEALMSANLIATR